MRRYLPKNFKLAFLIKNVCRFWNKKTKSRRFFEIIKEWSIVRLVYRILKIKSWMLSLNYFAVHDKTAVSAKLLNWEKRPFSPSRTWRYCIFNIIFFWHKPLWEKLKNKISCSLVLRAASNGSNSILTIWQILQSWCTRQYYSVLVISKV